MIVGNCPKCEEHVEIERFGYAPCPHCGAALEADHECYYDSASGEEFCEDWIALVNP